MSYCDEKLWLFAVYQKSTGFYSQLVSELASVSGSAIHSEFELLDKKVKAARQRTREARERYEQHRAAHHC